MLSVGIDLCEISRIEKAMRHKNFLTYILGNLEYVQLKKRNFPPQSVAASFAAKEAFSKAVGTGLSGFKITEAELLREESGKPYMNFTGKAKLLANNKNFSVSVSHTKTTVGVVVICEEK